MPLTISDVFMVAGIAGGLTLLMMGLFVLIFFPIFRTDPLPDSDDSSSPPT